MSLLYKSPVIEVDQYAALYDKPVEETEYEFVINIATGMNALFEVRTYTEDNVGNDLNNVIVNLTVNDTSLLTLFDSDAAQMRDDEENLDPSDGNQGDVFATIQDATYSTKLGRRFIEIAAIKIFGSAYATAAIRNDQDFMSSAAGSIYDQIKNGIQSHLNGTGIAGDSERSKIFNGYVATGQYNTTSLPDGDQDSDINFNFQGTMWDFPINLRGDVTKSDNSVITVTPGLTYFGRYDQTTRVLLRFSDNQ